MNFTQMGRSIFASMINQAPGGARTVTFIFEGDPVYDPVTGTTSTPDALTITKQAFAYRDSESRTKEDAVVEGQWTISLPADALPKRVDTATKMSFMDGPAADQQEITLRVTSLNIDAMQVQLKIVGMEE